VIWEKGFEGGVGEVGVGGGGMKEWGRGGEGREEGWGEEWGEGGGGLKSI